MVSKKRLRTSHIISGSVEALQNMEPFLHMLSWKERPTPLPSAAVGWVCLGVYGLHQAAGEWTGFRRVVSHFDRRLEGRHESKELDERRVFRCFCTCPQQAVTLTDLWALGVSVCCFPQEKIFQPFAHRRTWRTGRNSCAFFPRTVFFLLFFTITFVSPSSFCFSCLSAFSRVSRVFAPWTLPWETAL